MCNLLSEAVAAFDRLLPDWMAHKRTFTSKDFTLAIRSFVGPRIDVLTWHVATELNARWQAGKFLPGYVCQRIPVAIVEGQPGSSFALYRYSKYAKKVAEKAMAGYSSAQERGD